MHEPAQQHAVIAAALERQMLDIAFDQIEAGIFALSERHELGRDIDADGVIAFAAEHLGESAGAAAEIGDLGSARQSGQSLERVDQPRIRLRREHVIFVRVRMRVEELDLLLLVLQLLRRTLS